MAVFPIHEREKRDKTWYCCSNHYRLIVLTCYNFAEGKVLKWWLDFLPFKLYWDHRLFVPSFVIILLTLFAQVFAHSATKNCS